MKLDRPRLARSNAAFKLPVLPIVREKNSENTNEPIGFRQMRVPRSSHRGKTGAARGGCPPRLAQRRSRSFHASDVVVRSPRLFSSLADFLAGFHGVTVPSRATAPIPAPGERRRNMTLARLHCTFCRRRASFPSPGKLKGAAPKSGPLPVEMNVRDQMPAPASSILAVFCWQADSVQVR